MTAFKNSRAYYEDLYQMNLESLMVKCRCASYDPLNSNGEYILNDTCAYLSRIKNEIYGYPHGQTTIESRRCRSLVSMFKRAYVLFTVRYESFTGGVEPANLAKWKHIADSMTEDPSANNDIPNSTNSFMGDHIKNMKEI